MFDTLVSSASTARSAAERVAAFAAVENAACARRLTGMYDMLCTAYAASGSVERDQWRFDNWAAVCAMIGAAHDITSGVASGLLMDAEVLAERLPRFAAVFDAGRIAYRLVHLVCTRTRMVKYPDALAALDADLAEAFSAPGAMSVVLAQTTVDALVARHDPYAVWRATTSVHRKRVIVTTDADGGAHIDAEVDVIDAEAFDRRIDALAATVCPRDPRDKDARRSAAVGALGYGWDRLPCLCEQSDCEAAAIPAVGGIVIHLVGDRDAVDGADTRERPDPTPPPAPEPPVDPDPTDADIEPDIDPDDGDSGEGEDPGEGGWDDHPDDPVDPEPSGGSEPLESEPAVADESADEPVPVGEPEPSSEPEPAVSDAAESHMPATEPAVEPTTGGAPMGNLTAQRRALSRPLPLAEWLAGVRGPGEYCPAPPGVILGGGVVPAPLLAHAAMYATITALVHPGCSPPEPGYRPSRKLARFVRCRDVTCRYPGCTKPATVCDIDRDNGEVTCGGGLTLTSIHVIPYPYGRTQAANLACQCREHHLAKTFWPGFSVILRPDGTMVWTLPDGRQVTTHPGSRRLFPELCTPTAEAVVTGTPPPKHTAGLTMPKRRITRAEARTRAIDDHRRRNTEWAEQYLRDQIPPF